MSRRERGWTVAALVLAVVLLVGSMAWAVGAAAGRDRWDPPRWHDRGSAAVGSVAEHHAADIGTMLAVI